MKRRGESGTGLIWVLISFLVGALGMFAWGMADAKPAKEEEPKIVINKDGSVTIPLKLLEEYAARQRAQEALIEEVGIENQILKNELERRMGMKCVGVKK